MERNLDEVGIGNYDWIKILNDFYESFKDKLKLAEENMQQSSYVEEEQVSDVKCEKCGNNMIIKTGRFGKFLACPGFPKCKNTKPYYEITGIKCPKCGGDIVQKKSAKKGIKYYACISEECKAVFWGIPIGEKCPICNEELIKINKLIKCNNSKCKYKKKLEVDEESKEK
jgi:DNA topoisomerase-1